MERAFWHIWQPMLCSQGSVLQFSRCFLERMRNCLTHSQGCLICKRLRNFFVWRSHDFCVERLPDFLEVPQFFVRRGCLIFLCAEVAWVFVRRGWVMFSGGEVVLLFKLTYSRGCMTFFVERFHKFFLRLHDFCCGEDVWFFGGCVICFGWEVVYFFVWRGCVLLIGCMILCAERLRDFFRGCVMFLWRGCVIFLTH